MAVRKAVRAATITFATTSTMRFVFIIVNFQLLIHVFVISVVPT